MFERYKDGWWKLEINYWEINEERVMCWCTEDMLDSCDELRK